MNNLPAKKINDERRHELLGLKELTSANGITHFENKSLALILTLINEGFMNAHETMNQRPSMSELVDLAQKLGSDSMLFHGYIVSADRDDARVDIDAVTFLQSSVEATDEIKKTLKKLVKSADEVNKSDGSVYLWWD